MNKSLIELIKISRRVGRDPNLTCGVSGNTSVKTPDGRSMFIKASGTSLKDMNAKKGWCKINLQKVREIIGDKKLNKLPWKKREIEIARRLLAACEGNIKPSIESNLHAFLDKYVIHLHPIMVCAFLITKNGKAELEKLFADVKPAPLWVPYAKPGYSLAKKIGKLTIQYRKRYGRGPKILFLEKHGLFISASKPTDALKLVRKVIKRCEKKIKEASPSIKYRSLTVAALNPAIRRRPQAMARQEVLAGLTTPARQRINNAKQIIKDAFFAAAGQRQPVHFFHNDIISTFANSSDSGRLLKAGPLNPNEIIYTNGPAVWLDPPSPKASIFAKATMDKMAGRLQKEKFVSRFKKRKPPIAILVKNLGLFVIGSTKTASIAEKVVCSSLFIRYNAQRFGGIAALTKPEQDFIRNFGA